MKCSKCRWAKNQYVNCAPFDGPLNAEIIFCGQAFGHHEATHDPPKPFVGPAGKKLDELLALAGLKREDVALINALRCYLPGNPDPTKKEMDACFEYTLKDIREVNPKLVVALGASALYQLTGKEGIEKYRGKLIYSKKIGKKIFCTFHPAVCLYPEMSERCKTLNIDFRAIPTYLDKDPVPIVHYPFEYITAKKYFEKVYDQLYKKEMFFDIETTGLNPYKDDIRLLQLGNKENIYIVDGALLSEIRQQLAALFNTNPVIGQDFSFDAKFLSTKLDIFPSNWSFDTCLAEFLICGAKSNDLNSLTHKYVPESFDYDEEVVGMGGAHKVQDMDILLQYASDDVGVLSKVKRRQYKQLIKDNKLWYFDNILMPANKVLTRMSLRGVKYDIRKLKEIDEIYRKKADRAFMQIMGMPEIKKTEKDLGREFNPRSPVMIKHLLLDICKLPILRKTEKGNPSIGETEMSRYEKEYNNKYCMIMKKYRSHSAMRTNFLSGIIPKLDGDIAHTNYSLHIAASGRPSSSSPNLQNIPPEVRVCIVPRSDDYIFLHADLKQIEVRVAAIVYDDEELLKICNDEDADFHAMIAERVNELLPHAQLSRDDAKTITFGTLYQETPVGLAYQLNISERKAEEFIKKYFESFPDLTRNIEKAKRSVAKKGYVTNYFGFTRWWRFKQANDPAMLREAVNQPVQSLAWNLMELILIKIEEFLEDMKSYLVLQTYDDLVIETHRSEVDKAASKVKEVIEGVNKPFDELNKVKILTDIEIGDNLGELRVYEKV